ncbi:MAG: hypothetical protein JJE37_16195 [Methyloceanibacter sp.]|nr:hypothetical protein [Methyloceanibacter sp.]
MRDAFGHLKIIGHTRGAAALLEAAGIADKADDGVVVLAGPRDVTAFIAAAKQHRIWDREPKLRSPG